MKWAGVAVALVAVILAWAFFGPLLDDLPAGKALVRSMQALQRAVEQSDWDAATREVQAMKEAWRRLKPWATIIAESQPISSMEQLLARLEVAVGERDRREALLVLAELRSAWIAVNEL